MHFIIEEGDGVHGEYYPHDGEITIWLGGHTTYWGLIDTIVHEILHQAIEENCPDATTEKQAHWASQKICF